MPTTSFTNRTELSWPSPREWRLGAVPVLIPPLSDPRYLIWFFQLAFFVFGVEVGAFSKSYNSLVVAVAAAGAADFLLIAFRRRTIVLPQSGFIAGTGIALLLEANQLWYYAAGALAAVLSKHLLETNGRHVFNPSAYGALLIVLLFPFDAISNVSQWGGLTWFTVLIWLTGLITTRYAKVLSVAVCWMTSFAFFAVLRGLYLHASIAIALGVMSGPAFALFSFFMITDPRTVPTPISRRAVFCFLAAGIDAIFRVRLNPYAPFWGLVLASALYPFASSALDRLAARERKA